MAPEGRALYVCVDNAGYEASLERRKLYVGIPDAAAEQHGQLRIVDESGESYLYPVDRFVSADLPDAVRRSILQRT